MDNEFESRRAVFRETMQQCGVDRCVILTSTFRSGSTYVCSLLGKNGLPGIGKELFNAFAPFRKPGKDTEFREKLLQVLGRSEDGLFTTKLMWPQRNSIALALGFGRDEAAAFAAMFPNPKWINVVRNDRFAQAVSFWKAKQTKRWHVYAKEEEPEVEYDGEGIQAAFIELSTHFLLWQDFHALAGTRPYRIVYEKFLRNPEPALRALLAHVDSHRAAVPEFRLLSNLKKQGNAQSVEYRNRFIAGLYRV